ncbi:MAG: DUF1579 family protein [Halioglobus sp.]|nr:DUF1579 family protein [Halioglobus sp.]
MRIKKNVDGTAAPEPLMQAYAATAEHSLLSRLTGSWQVEGEWYLRPGQPLPLGGTMRNRGILGGHFIESSSFYDGVEKSRAIYGYDPDEGHFMVFAINAIAARYDIEHGHYDAASDALRFSGVEHVGPQRLSVRFERSITFLPGQGFDLTICYPDFKPERRLGMALRMRLP